MEPAVQVFWVPKLGNSEEEYEDASACSAPERRFAVADGATESSFSDRWAQGLVRRYTADPPLAPPTSIPLPEWVAPLQHEWHAGIPWDKLPWFAEEKARSGAYASLLGVHFAEPERVPPRLPFLSWFRRAKPQAAGFRWYALAIGDTCLFHVRNGQLLKAFPLDNAAAFSDRPLLLSSNPARNQSVWSAVQLAEGECHLGDVFFLATDALGKWFLQRFEAGGRPWETLAALRTQTDFVAWVDKRRQDRSLKNDDTTLVRLVWQAAAPKPAATAPGTPAQSTRQGG
jgi:hypothetical protein